MPSRILEHLRSGRIDEAAGVKFLQVEEGQLQMAEQLTMEECAGPGNTLEVLANKINAMQDLSALHDLFATIADLLA